MRIPFIKYNHQKHLNELAKLEQKAEQYQIVYDPKSYRVTLLEQIKKAQHRIYIVALYLEQDEAGREILDALYQAKMQQPSLDIKIFVDWHRAQRGRIGEDKTLLIGIALNEVELVKIKPKRTHVTIMI